MRKIFSFLFMLLVMVCQVSASEVYIETEGSDRYIALRADSPIAISGYFLQLNFSSKTEIASIEPISPFNGLANVKKTDGYAKVVAYNTELNSEKQKQIRFASIDYTGADDIEIIVIELYDENNRPVVVTNPQFTFKAPPSTPTPQEYSNPPGYISPGSPSETPMQPTQSGSAVEPVQSSTSESVPISTIQQQQSQDHTPGVTSGHMFTETPVSPASSPIRDELQSTPKQNLPLSVYLSLTGLIIVTLLFRDRRKCF
jgi:hypothetical protein